MLSMLLLSLLLGFSSAQQQRCASLSPSLQCSACEEFVAAFYLSCARLVFRARKVPSVQRVYKERLTTIFEDNAAADEIDSVDSMLFKAKGKEHELYKRVCAKYDVFEDDEYDGLETAEELEAKDDLLREALSVTVAQAKSDRWTVVGKNRRFEKVQTEDVDDASAGDDVASCFEDFAGEHEDTLIGTMMGVMRLKDADLHESLCSSLYCS